MELKINEIKAPEKISFNYEELKSGLLEKASLYEAMVYGEDEIKTAKADRAALNKLKKTLNDERLRQEKEYMKPFNEFKEQVREIISIIDKPVKVIDSQIKAYEERQREERQAKINEYYEGVEHPEWLEIKRIFEIQWLNQSTSMKKVKEAIDARLAQIAADLKALEALPEFSFEAIETYKQTLDITRAISEGHRLADIQKRKAEAEIQEVAEQAQATGTASCAGVEEAAHEVARQQAEATESTPEQEKSWTRFEALMTTEQAVKLIEFFEANGISFRAI